ncbi:uncharacterized protein LOC112588587 isoform X1 [Harpegnathos saltator]|uniref:uncharacterized protein LOC112588587 isoform X1 n=1 Tax=Harpegnathos saltator TaxID=610380 RepID=UPI000DBED70F|nr:uncharacterized protein LOC112588587 isoform X1 [Harpegnathos saltator]
MFESFESQEYDQNESQSQEYDKKGKKSSDYWSNSGTSFLLDKYETYMSDIGPMKKFKTKKLMWAQISKDMLTMLDVLKTPLQVENRYKTVLKRKKKQLRTTLNQAALERMYHSKKNCVKLLIRTIVLSPRCCEMQGALNILN